MFAIFRDTTPLVEGLSIDEAFLEVGGLRRLVGPPEEIAVRLRQRVRAEAGLAISVGVARTKFLAKVASAVSKPDGLLVVDPASEADFLLPLPVERLWGVGAVTAEKLHRLGITTVGQLAELESATAERLLGRATGAHLHALARLRDPRPVDAARRRGSIGSQRALGARRRSAAELDVILTQRRLRNAHNQQEGLDAAQEFPPLLTRRYQVCFKPLTAAGPSNTPAKALAVRQVRGEHLGHLITVRGIATRVSDVKPAVQVNAYSCDRCGCEIFQEVKT